MNCLDVVHKYLQLMVARTYLSRIYTKNVCVFIIRLIVYCTNIFNAKTALVPFSMCEDKYCLNAEDSVLEI